MAAVCAHDGFHSVTAHYDREGAQVVFVRTCDGCGVVLSELGRQRYRPRYRRAPGSRKNTRSPRVELPWS